MVGVTEPPIDVDRIAEALGFSVLPFAFDESTEGFTFIEGNVKSIGVNSSRARVRQRFTVAHELGHYLSGHENYDHGTMYVEDRPAWFDPQSRQEMEANEFAAALLMPKAFLRSDVSKYGLDVPLLAKRYEVSEQAMWIQLIDLGLASEFAKS